MFTTFVCRTNISSTLFSNHNCLYYKPPEHHGAPKVATCLVIDIYGVVQNFYVLIPQNSPKGCHSSRNLIIWQKFFNFFMGISSKLLESAYFPLFIPEMIPAIWLDMCPKQSFYKTHIEPKRTKGCCMSSDRYFWCDSEFLCFDSPQFPSGVSFLKKSDCLTKNF